MSNSTSNKGGSGRHCSFCNRNERQVEFLIPSPTGAYICNFCVDACNELISEVESYDAPQNEGLSWEELPRPIQIKEALDKYVIGRIPMTEQPSFLSKSNKVIRNFLLMIRCARNGADFLKIAEQFFGLSPVNDVFHKNLPDKNSAKKYLEALRGCFSINRS